MRGRPPATSTALSALSSNSLRATSHASPAGAISDKFVAPLHDREVQTTGGAVGLGYLSSVHFRRPTHQFVTAMPLSPLNVLNALLKAPVQRTERGENPAEQAEAKLRRCAGAEVNHDAVDAAIGRFDSEARSCHTPTKLREPGILKPLARKYL